MNSHIKWKTHYTIEYTHYQPLRWKLKRKLIGWEAEEGKTDGKGNGYKILFSQFESQNIQDIKEMIKEIMWS